MARLAALMAIFAMFLVAATATRSVVTTIEMDENQWRGGGQCRQQMQMAGGLNHCKMFMMDQARCGGQKRGSGRCQFGECDDDNQYTGTRGGCMSMNFEPCCDQLRQMDQQCRCEGLREVLMRQGQFGGQAMEEMSRVAQNLPQMCGMSPQYCHMSGRRGFF